jgi:hypothetical protein
MKLEHNQQEAKEKKKVYIKIESVTLLYLKDTIHFKQKSRLIMHKQTGNNL